MGTEAIFHRQAACAQGVAVLRSWPIVGSGRKIFPPSPFIKQEGMTMIGYVTLGSNDVTAAAGFYDELLAELGARRYMDMDNFILWAVNPRQPMLAVTRPHDGKAASVGNGSMVALVADSPALVDRLHQKALALNGTDEGAPGKRMDNFYAAYFRDLDGNKLAVFCATGF
jgi:predicted lactoylglutathione lyase